ncbi:MAG: Lipoprotein signal peptidase [Ktedonobacterales bacterium]|jgi:signal peptidase II|nr:MAG: Lipoprotein signal peptidase [Ktedonobacterales bacterium]
MSTARRNDLLMVATAIVLVILDQLTKRWVVAYFTTGAPKASIPLLGSVLDLEYVQNTGVAFSLLQGQAVLFLFIAVAIVVVGVLYWRTRDTGSLMLKLTFGLILGGALGNLIDRVTRGYVVDFVHFHIDGFFNFAVFNVADSGISIGVIILALLLWRGSANIAALQADESTTSAARAESPQEPGSASHIRNKIVSGR